MRVLPLAASVFVAAGSLSAGADGRGDGNGESEHAPLNASRASAFAAKDAYVNAVAPVTRAAGMAPVGPIAAVPARARPGPHGAGDDKPWPAWAAQQGSNS